METGQTITVWVAFAGGLVSFITPCVLPLVPVYLSILSGTSFDQLTGRGGEMTKEEQKAIHSRVIYNALAFILGFSIIFIVAGVVAGSLGEWLGKVQNDYGAAITNWLLVVFGVVMVFLGMNMSGVWKPMWLNTEKRFSMQKGKLGYLSSGLVGAAFAFGWTPCIGPILAPILALAAESGNEAKGAMLLAAYSFGLAIPFFLSALSINGLIAFSNKMKKHFNTLELVLGFILLIFGLGLFFMGNYGIKNKTDGLGPLRESLSFMDNFTSGIEEGLQNDMGDDQPEVLEAPPEAQIEDDTPDPDQITDMPEGDPFVPIVEDSELVQAIEDIIYTDEILAWYADTYGLELRSEQGTVTIMMKVTTEEQHQTLLVMVRSAGGLNQLIDEIEVDPELEGPPF